MSPLDKLNFFISTYGRLLVASFNIRLWTPLLLYLLVMVIVILLAQLMFSPLLAVWVVPLVKLVANETALHYPQHLIFLPYIFERFNLVPSLLIESLLFATTMLMFAAYFSRERVGFVASLMKAKRHYPKLLLVWLVNFALIYLLFKMLPELFHDFTVGSPRRLLALTVGMQGLSVLFSSLLIYVVPYLIIKERPLLASFTASFNLFFRNFFTTFFFVFIPHLFVIGLALVLQNNDVIVSRFHPRVMVGLTYFYALLMTMVSFFTLGGIVRFFLEVSED